MSNEINYGPLRKLIGVWTGDKGMDVAPEEDGCERNPYHETITYADIGHVKNAESQLLAVIRYHQVVQKKSNNNVFHDQVGYWIWEEKTNTIIHSVTIPRAVCLLAGGVYDGEVNSSGEVVLQVSAALDDPQWKIIQSPFMANNAKTISFSQRVTIGENKMAYKETTVLDIYGKVFDHTDEN
ncbi:MAG: heme-binding beta-barrel domain-containing protein, partial [Mariprofundaceae bacterium]|nr:heme-binding beta-barrel domain-containing protein [Mariprofundaceae bacterium]